MPRQLGRGGGGVLSLTAPPPVLSSISSVELAPGQGPVPPFCSRSLPVSRDIPLGGPRTSPFFL